MMAKRKSAYGKRQHKRCKKSTSENPSLGEDALGLVMQFLAPIELFRLAFTCKAMRDKVTVELVVRSALIHGGWARKTIETLHQLMMKRSIHPPSPLRLLRLVNARRCEICCKTAVRTVRPCSGVALCFQTCLVGKGFAVRRYEHMMDCSFGWDIVEEYPSVEATIERQQGYFYFWNRPLVQNGEVCGPLVTLQDLNANALTNADHLQILFRNAPPEQAYQEFIRTYDDFVGKADNAEKEREERRERKKEEKEQKHREAVIKKITRIQQQLDEGWRDWALSYHYPTDEEREARMSFLVFDCAACDQLLRYYVHNPRECRTMEIRDAANRINGYFATLAKSNFLGFSFLSDDRPFERALRQFCQVNFRNQLLLLPGADHRFFELLDQEEYFDALLCGCFCGASDYKVILTLLSFQGTDNLAQNLVNDKEIQHNGYFSGRRERLGAIYDSYQQELPQLLDAVNEYCRWLESRDDFDNDLVDRARSMALRDSSCLRDLRSKHFHLLLEYQRSRGFQQVATDGTS